ncbi:DNA polymerase-3 subunit gamma/tau [Megamonas sp. Calf98-2]|uniref:DNA polymerase III subunit gamma/tau n=1 Tax=Megamonas sp. Calf98-2 TaxID=1855330 RepID=UPI0008BE683C|nr:DNA polymerase III subunit gamma/tau [Megamonas sp. Calf98-2]SEN49221.1 DNA polymerase-3 subunit gamma/tau [Megamonas sp. Calf98-2]
MAYMALYRKWRPQDFSDLIGQEHISETLSNAISTGKVAHAYLFSGPRGTGKTSTAKILAKALNCEHGPTPTPCNQCVCCQKINDGSFMDVFEIDAASNRGIDEIRDLRETVKFAPVDGKYKVYIIDEVHMLTTEAFNALLKTLEEPPSHVVFILATTEVHKVPITIQSRCQRYDFKRITKDDILKRLVMITDEMGLNADKDALSIIAIQADGGMRDALSLLDQCLAFTKDELTVTQVRKVLGLVGHDWVWQITDALSKKDSQTILTILDEVIAQGKEIKQLLNELVLHFRSIMLYKASNKLLNLNMYFEDEEVLSRQAKEFTHDQIMQIIQKIHEAINEIKWASQPRITAEVLFLKLCWQGEAENNNSEKIMSMMNNIPAVNNKGASEVKIMALEQTVSRLDRIVKALSSQLANMQEQYKSTPMTNTPMMNTFVEPRQNTVKRASKIVKNEPVHTNIMPMENADATAIWQNVLAGLNARRKKVVVACVNRALPYRIADNQFFIHFDSPFLQARTEKDDYRLLIEEVLENVTGHNLRLVCTCGDLKITQMPQVNTTLNNNVDKIQEIKAPKVTIPMIEDEDVLPQGDYQADIPMPTDEDYVDIAPTDVDYDNMTPEGKHTLQTAIEIFGGKIIPEDNK